MSKSRRLWVLCAFLGALTIASHARADNTSTPSTATGIAHGGYGAPSFKFTRLASTPTMLAGVEGGWIIDHRVVLGGAGYATVHDVSSPMALQNPSQGAALGIRYGGFRAGTIIDVARRTQLTAGMLIGGGLGSSETRTGSFRRSDTFYVVEPDLEAEIALSGHVRFALGASYRFVGGMGAFGFTPSVLGGPAATMSMRIGAF